MRDRYVEQVRLLMRALPSIAEEEAFALKGGSAINLFYRNLPRLSVDIDLVYLPIEAREISWGPTIRRRSTRRSENCGGEIDEG